MPSRIESRSAHMSASSLSGRRLAGYDVGPLVGAGGMGEVYRARDSKLNRDVAIKILLPAVANDADRLARFRREAQVLASLNHQNIAHIHGLEEGEAGPFLVMEFVEGPTLADRIAQGRFRSMKRSRSRGRSPTRSRRRMSAASFIAT